MTLSVHAIHCESGDAFKEHALLKLSQLDEKYFGRGLNASVTLSKTEGKKFRTNIVFHSGPRDFQADAVSHNAHRSLEKASAKLAKQLRRMKARVRDDHRNRAKKQLDNALNESLVVQP